MKILPHCDTASPLLGCPGGTHGKEPTCQCRKHKKSLFNPWVGKIPWRRAWKSTPCILAWRIPWTEEPCSLQSTGSQRVRLDWSGLAWHSLLGVSVRREWICNRFTLGLGCIYHLPHVCQGVDIYTHLSVCMWIGRESQGVFSWKYINMGEDSRLAGICHLF